MKILILIFAAFTLSACAHQHMEAHHEPSKVTKGDMAGSPYTFRSNTYFMGQPTLATFDEAKKLGVTTIINLQTPTENAAVGYVPAEEVKKRGLTYYNFPINSDKELSKDDLAKIEGAFMSHHKKGEKVIVHCTSGQRAGAWFAYHIRNTHGDSADQALKEAMDIGLSKPVLIEKVKVIIQ